MKTRLFNDNAGETLTESGYDFSKSVQAALEPIVEQAIACNSSLRDLTKIVEDEMNVMVAENLIRLGIKSRKAERNANFDI